MAFIYGMLAAWVFDLLVVALFLRYRGTIRQHISRFLGLDQLLTQQNRIAEHLMGPDETGQ